MARPAWLEARGWQHSCQERQACESGRICRLFGMIIGYVSAASSLTLQMSSRKLFAKHDTTPGSIANHCALVTDSLQSSIGAAFGSVTAVPFVSRLLVLGWEVRQGRVLLKFGMGGIEGDGGGMAAVDDVCNSESSIGADDISIGHSSGEDSSGSDDEKPKSESGTLSSQAEDTV